MIKWENSKNATQRFKQKAAKQATKPLSRKEVARQLKSGKLTKEEAIELRQKYMDSLEYKEDQQFVTYCGGIRPLPIFPPLDEEE